MFQVLNFGPNDFRRAFWPTAVVTNFVITV